MKLREMADQMPMRQQKTKKTSIAKMARQRVRGVKKALKVKDQVVASKLKTRSRSQCLKDSLRWYSTTLK
jgi:hypothetical protein